MLSDKYDMVKAAYYKMKDDNAKLRLHMGKLAKYVKKHQQMSSSSSPSASGSSSSGGGGVLISPSAAPRDKSPAIAPPVHTMSPPKHKFF